MSVGGDLKLLWEEFDVASHKCIKWSMILSSVSSCEVARAFTDLTLIALHPCLSSHSIALILQNICLYRVPYDNFCHWSYRSLISCSVGPQYAPLHNMLLLVAYCVPCIHNMLRWSILCTLHTQYASSGSILCRVDTYMYVISVVVRGYTICSS